MREGVFITYGEADEILNSKTEYHQPGVTRVVPTREVGRCIERSSRLISDHQRNQKFLENFDEKSVINIVLLIYFDTPTSLERQPA